jgi:PadR family transcriptional regulator, regulatory protein PadR
MAHSGPKMTIPTQLVLRVLLEEPTKERYGLEVCELAGLPSGTIHPILARLENAGWLTSRWEDVDPREQGRPRRRYYQLTPDGTALARNALARSYTGRRVVAVLRPRTVDGR